MPELYKGITLNSIGDRNSAAQEVIVFKSIIDSCIGATAIGELNSMIAGFGVASGKIFISGHIAISSNYTTPENITIEPVGAGLFTIATGCTLTISGPFICAPEKQAFALTGTGAVAGLRQCSVENFGAVGDGITDDLPAIQAAVAATNGEIYLCSEIYTGSGPIVVGNPGNTVGDGNDSTPTDTPNSFCFVEKYFGSLRDTTLNPLVYGKNRLIQPMVYKRSRSIHNDIGDILYVGAIQTTQDIRTTFAADISVDPVPGLGEELNNPAGSTHSITNRKAGAGGGAQIITNRVSGGNLTGMSWRRDWTFSDEFKYYPTIGNYYGGRRRTGDLVLWQLTQGGDSVTSYDDLAMCQGQCAVRNGVLRFWSNGNLGEGETPDYTQISNSEYMNTYHKGMHVFDLTGDCTSINNMGGGLVLYNNVLFRAKWNNVAQRFDLLNITYDSNDAYASGSTVLSIADRNGGTPWYILNVLPNGDANFGGDIILNGERDEKTIRLYQFNDAAGYNNAIKAYRARGVYGTPTSVTNDMSGMSLMSNFYLGSAYKLGGLIRFKVVGAPNTEVPTKIEFATATDTVAATVRLTIAPNGDHTISSATEATSATAAALVVAGGGAYGKDVWTNQKFVAPNTVNAGTDTDKFLVLDATGNHDFRTGAETLSDINGQGVLRTTRRVTATPATVTATDQHIFVDTDSLAITVNLPAGVNGTVYKIVNCGSAGNAVTITPNGTEKLFGSNTSEILYDGETIEISYETTEGWW